MKVNHPLVGNNFKKEQNFCENLKQDEIIDATGVEDNFYNNIMDWSSQQIISVATTHSCYLKNTLNKTFAIMP